MRLFSEKPAVLIGTAFELYDYALYSNFSYEIGKTFFQNESSNDSLIYTFLAFSIAYLVRPLGGFIFSHCSNRYGRKPVLFVSMLMMVFSTLLIGLSPSAIQIGIMASAVLITARIIQGFAISGEFVTSMIYVIEKTTPRKRGYIGSTIFSFGMIGMLIGMLVHLFLSTLKIFSSNNLSISFNNELHFNILNSLS